MYKFQFKRAPANIQKELGLIPKDRFYIQDAAASKVSKEFMWHLNTFFKLNPEEKKILYEYLKIQNSTNVSNSTEVYSSKNVFMSEDVNNSSDIVNSKVVEDSNSIYKSEFIFYSTDVFQSFNITNGNNITKSSRIINSENIYRSEDLVGCNCVEFSKNLNDCLCCSNCNDLSNSLFCNSASGEDLLFNQPQTKENIEIYKRQLLHFKPRLFLCDFDRDLLHAIMPKVNNDFSIHYSTFNFNFWNWIETLPGYNIDILYQITYDKKIYLS